LACFEQCCGNLHLMLYKQIPGVGAGRLKNLREWLQKEGHLLDRETPAEEILAGLKGRYSSSLGLGEPGWVAVERFVLMAAGPEVPVIET